MKIKILIVDDHPIFRKGLKAELIHEPSIKIVGEAADSNDAIALTKKLSPDVIILDVNLPGKNGIEIAKEIRTFSADIKIIFLTMYNEEDLFNMAFDVGASAYLLKENAVDEVIAAVNEAYNGGNYVSQSVVNYFVNRKKKVSELFMENPGIKNLTEKEKEILRLISQGKTSKEIADELFLSYKTVENHRTRICGKLSIKGAFALLKFAIENKSII
ncbi:MAG: response regulator transcription factor [Ignavibacteria bacterium]|jgi:DNA-binding NarL/FixJ family response regulator